MAIANSTKRTRKRHSGNGVLIPAVGYIRMSSDKQEASPEQQKAEITKLADRDGYKILRWYQDDGIAGWKEEREGFQRLIGDIDKRGDFQAVLCWDQNRFSRFPVLEANHYWYLLDKAGIHLCTVNQKRIDWHSIAGWLTASIKQHADSQHRFQLSADVKRGKRARAEKGEWQGVSIRRFQMDKINQKFDDMVKRVFGTGAVLTGCMGSSRSPGDVRIQIAGRVIGMGDTFQRAFTDAQATARREIGRQADSLMLTRPDALQGN